MSATALIADVAGYRGQKRVLLSRLTGTVLEIGAGKGVNFDYYRRGVRWIGLEPNGRQARRLAQRAARYGHRDPILVAHAEQIPLADRSVDAVVSTIVLCSVADQARVLAEVRRVLRPGGLFVFFEHVAGEPGTWTRRVQRWSAPLTRRFDSGCDPTRETWRAIEGAGFDEVDLGYFRLPGGFVVYSRYIAGEATVG